LIHWDWIFFISDQPCFVLALWYREKTSVNELKVTIELPLERYDQLRDNCDMSSPEFSILMNGCIDRRPKSVGGNQFERFIQILCEKAQAEALLGLAMRFCPDAVPAIKCARKFPAITRAAAFARPLAAPIRKFHNFI
jgi:hypothetical protein